MAQKDFAFKVTQASLNQTAMDFPRNMQNIYDAIRIAVEQGSDMVAFEELALTGYDCGDDFQKTDNAKMQRLLEDIAAYAAALDPNLIISIGHPWRFSKRDIPVDPRYASERAKSVLFNRLDLPFNVQSIITGGKIEAMTAKMFLYNDERGYEKRYFGEWSIREADEAGGNFGTLSLPLGGREIPFGRPIVHFRNGKNTYRLNLAHIICEEKWVESEWGGAPYNTAQYKQFSVAAGIERKVSRKDGLLLVMPNASPPAPLKMDKHKELNALASHLADAVIDTDGLGSSGSTFAQFGHRQVVQDGRVISQGARMGFGRVQTNTTTIRLSNAPVETNLQAHAWLAHEFNNAADPEKGEVAYKADMAQVWDDPANVNRHAEEILRNTALWLFDYMRKVGIPGAVEALSGGMDSCFNTVMIAVMVRLAVAELGVDGFLEELKLPYAKEVRDIEAKQGKESAVGFILDRMITTAYMGTTNSSFETRNAASFTIKGGTLPDGTAVKGIGGRHIERNVQDILDIYAIVYAIEDTTKLSADPVRREAIRKDIADYLNRREGSISLEDLTKEAQTLKEKYPEITDLVSAANPRDGVAYENIQARARQVLIMMIANIEGKMAIANPNLDEARNAYATFGGDLHSGTVNLNAHVNKAYQIQLMQYLYDHGIHGVMEPVKSLHFALKNKPTAELQPKNEKGEVTQNDEDALQRTFPQMNHQARLMLYEQVTDTVGKRLLNAAEVFMMSRKDPLFAAVNDASLYNMVVMTYKRWGVSQHKIHASPIAPTFGSNVDHQVSRRTPNLSGGGRDELAWLGVNLIEGWAKQEGVRLKGESLDTIYRRVEQDETFVAGFERVLRSRKKGLNHDLRQVYELVKTQGWSAIAKPLASTHPVSVLSAKVA